MKFERYSSSMSWAAAYPPDSWGRSQDLLEKDAAFYGLKWEEHVEFWSHSDGTGRIYYGADVSEQFRAAAEREQHYSRLIKAFERYDERFDDLFLIHTKQGEEKVIWWIDDPLRNPCAVGEPYAGGELLGKAKNMVRLKRWQE